MTAGELNSVFRLGEELSKGPYGTVYLAQQASVGRPVVVRFLPKSFARDRGYMERLRDDGAVAARVQHPNVAPLLDMGECPERGTYQVYGYAPGATLSGRALPEGEALAIVLSLCGALDAAAQLGLSHGRVAPGNVRMEDGVPRLLNLGLSRQKLAVAEEEYLAPEQWDDISQASVASDVYGLGALLYRLLTGEAPPLSEEDDVPSPSGASPATSTLLKAMTAREPRRRYGSPRAVGRDIELLLHGAEPLGARATDSPALSPGSVKLAASLSLPGPVSRRPELQPGAAGAPAAAKRAAAKPARALSALEAAKAAIAARAAPPDSQPAATRPEPQEVAPGKVKKTKVNFYGDGFLINKQEEAWLDQPLEEFDPKTLRGGEASEEKPALLDSDEEDVVSTRMILNEDMSRAYKVVGKLGEGGYGAVYKVEVQGDASYPSFSKPVKLAALKSSKNAESLLRERAIYSEANPSIIKLLDKGTIEGSSGEKPFIVLERLYPHPFSLFGPGEGGCRCDPATAIDTYVNLLASLHELHFRKNMPLVLCDLKPDNIMLRMSGDSLTVRQYMSRLSAKAYKPVLMDLGCAQHSGELRKVRGQVREVLATPIYMPPESFPRHGRPGVVRDRMDVYALTLTFYQYLTGARPYSHEGIYEVRGKARMRMIMELKENKVSPIDIEEVAQIYGNDTDVYQEIFTLGLHPNPDHRVTAIQLLQLCMRRFRVEEVHPRPDPETYAFDVVKGIHLVQQVYSPLDLATNLYLKPDLDQAPVKKSRLGRDKPDGSDPVTGRFTRPTAIHKRPTGTHSRPTGVHPRPTKIHKRATGSFKRPEKRRPPPDGE